MGGGRPSRTENGSDSISNSQSGIGSGSVTRTGSGSGLGTGSALGSIIGSAIGSKSRSVSNSSSIGPGSGGGYSLLLRFIESSHFSLFLCVSYLERYADNLGIHYHLCNKIRTYPPAEVEFFLPQLVQLHVTVETESMALEDLLIELCDDSTHCTLLVFWQLQAHLTESSTEPESYGFQVCKRLYNKLQYLLFNVGSAPSHKLRENTGPAIILASLFASGVGMPAAPGFIKPLMVSQGRKQRTHIFHIATKLLRSKSTSNVTATDNSKKSESEDANSGPPVMRRVRTASTVTVSTTGSTSRVASVSSVASVRTSTTTVPAITDAEADSSIVSEAGATGNASSLNVSRTAGPALKSQRSTRLIKDDVYLRGKTEALSLPDLSSSSYRNRANSDASPPLSPVIVGRRVTSNPTSQVPRQELVRQLKTNYFRCETQFVYALQSISTRLLQVPKQARLAALRVELALINRDLPAEVDIPLLLPTRTNGPNPTQNRIVRISPAEATVLNSAEKVPFLMLIEFLRDDVDFNPDSEKNKHLLSNKTDRRYIFDMAYLHDQRKKERGIAGDASTEIADDEDDDVDYNELNGNDELIPPTEERDVGDMSMVGLYYEGHSGQPDALTASISALPFHASHNDSSSSPRASNLSFSSSYVSPASSSSNNNNIDITDLATHMRTAAIMLTQLDGANGSKLPRDEIASIKAKIIANMQSMEDHTMNPTTIFKGEAGERKLENDLKTAGIGASDDPSAANLGEDWTLRKERIRRTSPYGHLPNWDLFSVIAKTGFDLRQEAFACQLIEASNKIWADSGVSVWVKKMRILITSESTGLVETITNGLSIHSIKKALTNASIANGTNPKGTIASLSEHFEKKFGARGSDTHNEALSCFAKSLAPYSILSYILQIKDRHNGNILLDNYGHIIHIDFGFLLSNSPGQFGFEAAPFKLTQEYVDLMGGVDSEYFQQFRYLLKQTFKTLRKHAESIIILVEMMSRDSNLPCFSSGPATSLQLRQRFQLHLSDTEVDQFVDNVLIQKSLGSIYTRLYDQFQLLTQGIYS
ncbi:1-phosphatidylinositol 4-kinase [Sugiyamaella lignohabitans]|uniref:1-phosphatidylinositol 4-kinase n=1 Tax=Sugiyamaella lignohabitans TaxID=796027 RepID=A0A167DDQ9_9ASCO|nr:1-phosphatidylinositol 4-kinase [Sugiyamaella lignohabitans]ANB12800.1 1-phosphatidylinositol 4-kinase [Sugiyamaella lignohabitans]